MNEKNSLIISKTDFEKIMAITANLNGTQIELLEDELERAFLVDDDKLPQNAVAMNSVVSFEDISNGKISKVTLVYPQDANYEENKISIIAPIGAALIGLSVGQTIDWPVSENKIKRIKVVAVTREN